MAYTFHFWAIIRLYEKVSRQQELYRKILVFSISHDHQFATLYGHYVALYDGNLRFFPHSIHSFSFIKGERWTAYKSTRSVYKHFVPIHLDRIRSALSKLEECLPESVYQVSRNNDAEAPESRPALQSLMSGSATVLLEKKA